MSILRFLLIAFIFIALLFISLQNAETVTVRLFTFYAWQAPLVFVILIAFASGVALGMLAAALKVARLSREVSRLRRKQREEARAPLTHPQLPGPGTGPGFDPPTTGF